MIAGKLTVHADGRLAGPASISYNSPFPCVNGSWGSGTMQGVIMHTMVGNLPGTISLFNNSSANVSAHFGIDQNGHIHQFGPIGKGWIAWAQAAGNHAWYSIEHADNGNPNNPLTEAQLTASAQVVECLSAFAGFPLQVTDSTSGKGYGTHNMGGSAWGGHTCPDLPPHHVRSRQRTDIIERARIIRNPPVKGPRQYVAKGNETWSELGHMFGVKPHALAWETGDKEPGGFGPFFAADLDAALEAYKIPLKKGTIIWVPALGK